MIWTSWAGILPLLRFTRIDFRDFSPSRRGLNSPVNWSPSQSVTKPVKNPAGGTSMMMTPSRYPGLIMALAWTRAKSSLSVHV